ncbi:hypothetical protein CWO89_24415 [Bradyrhizobium sp. Leo170]|nr:hypothetical protein CWO89_24415 [Bradyrhizobium sp. Leo170]
MREAFKIDSFADRKKARPVRLEASELQHTDDRRMNARSPDTMRPSAGQRPNGAIRRRQSVHMR